VLCRTAKCAAPLPLWVISAAHERGLLKAQKVRMRLGGTANMLDDFPEKPKGMHWRTYERLCRVHDVAKVRSIIGLTDFAKRLRKRAS